MLNTDSRLFLNGCRNDQYSYSSINHTKGYSNEMSFLFLVEGYKTSTLLLLENLTDKKDTNWLKIDSQIYPVLFNFRHFIELILKDTIRYYKLFHREINTYQIGFEKEHSLLTLWKTLLPYLIQNTTSIPCEVLNAIENIIEEVESLDRNSFSFRYPFNTADNRNKKEIVYSMPSMTINLTNLSTTIKEAISALEGLNYKAAALYDN